MYYLKFISSSLLYFLIFFSISLGGLQAQNNAQWVSYPTANTTDYGVYHFRKSFTINERPSVLKIHISADNRYNLFVNGQRVSYGPAKGDLKTYKYDIVDLAPFLQQGKNIIAAWVYNGGADKPLAFLSAQTAFYLDVEDDAFAQLRTGSNWKTFQNQAYTPISYNEMLHKERWFYGFYACGPGDDLDGSLYPWGWETLSFDDSNWVSAEVLTFNGGAPWNLVPRNIPFMADHKVKAKKIRSVTGISIPEGFLENAQKITVPANSKASVLIDFEVLTMGYPELTVSRGKGSSVKVKYAEALYEKVNLKAHRDSVNGKTMYGVWDVFRPDGKNDRVFRPLWKRTFRYVQLVIETAGEPLDIISYESEYSGYPYPEMAVFESNDDKLNEIFKICNRTLQMCSAETYYDTPFYEQLSYGGDNRPISAISTYNSNDDRLLREVLRLYPQSKNFDTKLFKSAYPSRFDFDMGTWSLAWIQTLYDYYLMRGDAEFIKPFSEDIDDVLGFFHRHMDEEKGILGTVISRNFVDWSIHEGRLPRSNDKNEITHSALLTLYYAHTLDCASKLYSKLGFLDRAEIYKKESDVIKVAIKKNFWDNSRKLFADNLEKDTFSQHANILAILCDILSEDEQKVLLDNILTNTDLDEYASTYFSFFLFKAMEKTNKEHLFLENLDLWYQFLDKGHTTCGETGFASHDRSDSHAWSAHPSYYLLKFVCGIRPADVGFKTVDISPNLGDLASIKASMPHKNGRIEVTYSVVGKFLDATIILPPNLGGKFKYNGEVHSLQPGKNKIRSRKKL
ncbi:family 78 glycoside hydrolase catalytic domain [Galbibacter sp. BG1]|uniref:family 78 glycoside hydrolase catalytic domain n=1 Tax=Galbibacter sp. BG1 TaxID=1170699 RepID=UPI0015BACF1C|nr:family 78 glycoside hydrolase catalytic domain [Galbibacter sp. BG1]QLE01719.1 family 78 glycoside hydrolase catalytic domain [Galbibacter sp. BG1]